MQGRCLLEDLADRSCETFDQWILPVEKAPLNLADFKAQWSGGYGAANEVLTVFADIISCDGTFSVEEKNHRTDLLEEIMPGSTGHS
jgi:hypothetical protein